MKKSIVFAGCILALMLPFLNGCEKDYLDSEDIQYSLSFPDTVWLNEPVTIKGTINQKVDFSVYEYQWGPENLIGKIKPPCDSIIWTPKKEGLMHLFTQVSFKSGRHEETGLPNLWEVFVKKRPEAQ